MNRRPSFSLIMNHFSYLQIYIFICLLFFLSLIPIGYFWVITHTHRISMINEQLEELNEERSLIGLFRQLQLHRLLAQLSLSGNVESQAEIQSLDEDIRKTMKETLLMKHLKGGDSTYEPAIWLRVDPRIIEKRWHILLQQMSQISPDESESIHTSIIQDLLIQFAYLSDKVGVDYFKETENYAMIESVFLRLPYLQENLSQVILLSSKDIISHGEDLSRDRLTILINLIESDLSYLKLGMDFHVNLYPNSEDKLLLQTLNEYRESIEDLIETINDHLLNAQIPSVSFAQFQIQAKTAIKLGYQLWEDGLDILKRIFTAEKNHVYQKLWIVLIITILLAVSAFLLGLALTRIGTSRLSQLTEAMNSFTNGNFSIRIPDPYQDQIGKQAQAFNRMAQKLEEIVNHLNELLSATKALANGDLTTRIPTDQRDPEFDQVAQSFNKMAETFEIIIGRLQQIGIMLTTSASEIAAASQDQETIIVEQEGATHEIAIATKEISSTAKELAHTMNEVNQVAEQTASLALKGKDALNNMESIMRQMDDASSSLSSKLEILNEKAGNITGVITTITKVADQTNLLSLNASIEAEKAGEYGRSFAVIAREIRRLADQTAIATLDIEKIINEIMSAVSSSVLGVDEFTQDIRKGVEQVRTVSGQLAKIIEQVQAFTARFELVNRGMQAQSTGAGQINEAIAQLSQTAEQTSEAIHQFHRTIQELNKAANELRILTPFLKANLKDLELPSEVSSALHMHSFETTSKESTRQFNKTLSNLNVAANKLKNLNIQLHPINKPRNQ
jgi:methyl-accepting chemotaxis protein WspA